MAKETITTLTMKTAAAFAQQSKVNKAARAEIISLRAEIDVLRETVLALTTKAQPAAKLPHVPYPEWKKAHDELDMLHPGGKFTTKEVAQYALNKRIDCGTPADPHHVPDEMPADAELDEYEL